MDSSFAKLFLLQVGRERLSVFCLMQKFVDLKSLGTNLKIISAFAVEHMKGFVYIEAERQCDINEVTSVLAILIGLLISITTGEIMFLPLAKSIFICY